MFTLPKETEEQNTGERKQTGEEAYRHGTRRLLPDGGTPLGRGQLGNVPSETDK